MLLPQHVEDTLEEDEPVLGHPRSPYHRGDAIASSRHVRVELAGATLAESTRPLALFETDEPTRFYLAQADVRLDLLEPSETATPRRYPAAPPGSRPASVTSCTAMSPGPTASRSLRCRASRGCSPSATSSSASSEATPGRQAVRTRSTRTGMRAPLPSRPGRAPSAQRLVAGRLDVELEERAAALLAREDVPELRSQARSSRIRAARSSIGSTARSARTNSARNSSSRIRNAGASRVQAPGDPRRRVPRRQRNP